MNELMKTVTFRFDDDCSAAEFALTISGIQAMPAVEMVTSVKRAKDASQQNAMFTAFLYDSSDEDAVKRQISEMPGIVSVTNIHDTM